MDRPVVDKRTRDDRSAVFAAERDNAKPPAALRPVEPADAEALHALLLAGLPDIQPVREQWRVLWQWQYWDNPFRQGRPAGWVLEDDERIIGHLGAVYVPLRAGRRRCPGVIGADYVVSAESAPSGGLFAGLQLAHALFNEAGESLVLATTANEKTGTIFGRFGCRPVEWTREFWRAPANEYQLARSCRGGANRLVRKLMTGFGGSTLVKLTGWYYQLLKHRPPVPIPQGGSIEITCPHPSGRLGPMYEWIAKEQDGARALYFGLERTAAYFDWRYTNHPRRENIRGLIVRDHQGDPLGMAVIFINDLPRGRITCVEDMMVLPGRQDLLKVLLCASLKMAVEHDSTHLLTTGGRHDLRGIFWELGFESRSRRAPALLIQRSDAADYDELSPEQCALGGEFWHGQMF